MPFVSYSQNFEDVLLWRALGGVKRGQYLDIGAQDPEIDSVSRAFYDKGWRGVHVEPTPAYAEKLRNARPDETVIQAAISGSNVSIEFYEFPGTGLSTGKAAVAERHVLAGFSQRKIVVPCLTLEHLLESQSSEFHWMKIDVEGMEFEVLQSWGRSERRPWIVVVEATAPLTQKMTHKVWIRELSSRGYVEVHFDGLSRYFLHEGQSHRRKAFEAPPNVFDEFTITRRHFSAIGLNQELQAAESAIEAQRSNAELLHKRLEDVEHTVVAERERAALSENLARKASRERDAARAEQLATYNDWLAAERRHAENLALVESERKQSELMLRRTTDRLALRHAATRGALVSLRERTRELSELLETVRSERDVLAASVKEKTDRIYAAEALIEKSLETPATRWSRLGLALGLTRPDPVKAILNSWNLQKADADIPRPEADVNSPIPLERSVHRHASSIAELLSMDGIDFVRSSYATLLGREADPQGETYYADRLRRDVPKMQILYQIRKSPEAKLLLDPLPGLDQAFRQFRLLTWALGRKKAALRVESHLLSQIGHAHVEQFMQYHDQEFVDLIYRYYLGRDPEPEGSEYYLSRIRRGVSRQQILVEIANSRESKLRGRKAIGQTRLENAVSLERMPVIGSLVSIIRFNFRIQSHLQDMRAMQNYLYRFAKKVG